MLSKAPDAALPKDENPLVDALFNYQLVHVEAYIVYVDMVLRNEVAFKLTRDSIEALIEYHKEIHCVDVAATPYNWSEKELQVTKLHEEFIKAINKFVYLTHVSALEGLEEDGAGELLCGKSEKVKNNILALFLPLLPPPYNWLEKKPQVSKLHKEFIQAVNSFVYMTHATSLEGLEEDGAGELLCGKSKEVKNNIMNLFLPLLPPRGAGIWTHNLNGEDNTWFN